MNANQTCTEAARLLTDDRAESYGDPVETCMRVASIASLILGRVVLPDDVAVILLSTKLAREQHAHRSDNLVDAAAYCGILNACREV